MLTAGVQVLTAWRERSGTSSSQRQELDRAVAEIHGSSGSPVRWMVSGPKRALDDTGDGPPADSRTQLATGTEVCTPFPAILADGQNAIR